MTFETLGLEMREETNQAILDNKVSIEVKSYLPINEKAKFIEFVASNALDNNNGTFSPLRVELFYGLAICKWYADIDFGELDVAEVYDLLDTNHVISRIMAAIPQEELDFLADLVKETIQDMSRYYSSAAGIIQGMSDNAGSLDEQINSILSKIQNAEGLETLSQIKNIMGEQKPVVVVKKG